MAEKSKYRLLQILSFLSFLIFTNIFYPQVSSDSSNYFFPRRDKHLILQSVKHINTLNFTSDLFYNNKFKNFNYGIDSKINNSYFFANNLSYRISRKIKFHTDYSFFDFLKTGFYLVHNFYNDDKRLTISSAEVNQAMLYAGFSKKYFELNLFGGISNNSQVNETDFGFLYGVEGLVENYSSENQLINSRFHFSNEDILPRRNLLRTFEFGWLSNVSQYFSNNLSFSYYEGGRDFYTQIDSLSARYFNVSNNIEKRYDTHYKVEEKANFIITNSFKVFAAGKVFGQTIAREKKYINPDYATTSSFNPSTERFLLDFSTGFNYSEAKTNLFFKINYFEKEENFYVNPIEGVNEILFQLRQNQEERKNNLSKFIYLSLGGKYAFSTKDIFSFTLFHRKLIYNTPSEENFDDRDELLSMFRISYSRLLSYLFKINFNVEGSLNHVVYIFSERSSNNNINRIIRFSSEGIYRGKNVTSYNKAEVSANYTVYDFEDIIPNSQSFVFRQVSFRDSTSIYFNNNIGLQLFGYIKFAEQGQFSWEQFAEKPFQFRKEIYAEPLLLYNYSFFRTGFGIRYFTLIVSNFKQNDLFPLSNYLSLGPSIFGKLNLNRKLIFVMHGWYEFIKNNNNFKNQNFNFNLNFLWKI